MRFVQYRRSVKTGQKRMSRFDEISLQTASSPTRRKPFILKTKTGHRILMQMLLCNLSRHLLIFFQSGYTRRCQSLERSPFYLEFRYLRHADAEYISELFYVFPYNSYQCPMLLIISLHIIDRKSFKL